VRNAVPRLAQARSHLCHPGPARCRLRAAAPTAKSGRVVRSSGPRGPLHRRPRLRHGAHRRGDASAASRPPQARACVVEKVCLSAQPPADRSVQRLMQRRHWTAPAHRWAARRHSCPPSARQRARMDAAPCLPSLPPKGPGGRHRRRCALPVRLIPLAPHPPREFCQSLRLPAGQPPWSGRQRRLYGVPGRPRCWRTAVAGPARAGGTGGARACRTRRRRGLAGSVVAACPHTPRRSLRSVVGRMVFYWPGCVLPGTSGGSRAPSPDRQPWQRGTWRWPAPGSRTRLPVAAALFLPPQDAQCNPGGATSRAGLATLGAPAHP